MKAFKHKSQHSGGASFHIYLYTGMLWSGVYMPFLNAMESNNSTCVGFKLKMP